MSKADDLRSERDSKLDQAEHYYRSHQDAIAEEKENIKQQAEEKTKEGKNCDAEMERYNELSRQEDANYDNYKAQRDEIYSEYESQIQEAEQEEEAEQDEDYQM
jgi:hypothetical protein